jgi:hypothetical protein
VTRELATVPLHRAFVHLAALASLAIAQPLLDLLGRYPAFFAAHDSTRWEIVGFALVLVLAPPLVLIALEALAGLVSAPARGVAHLVFVAGLAAIVALQVVRRAESLPTWLVFALALLPGVAAAAIYARVDGVRSFASVLGAAPVLFLALFLFGSSTSKLVTGGTAKAFSLETSFRPPIVLIVFDAWPSNSFMTGDMRVDAKRFPNLARLARDGVWYRNASTVHENTVFSVPSILDGRIPSKGTEPIVQDHPNNLFTLLGKTYDMNVAEEATSLCPPGLCHETNAKSFGSRMRQLAEDVSVVYEYLALPVSYRKSLPQITDTWAGFRERGAETKPQGTKRRGAAFVLRHLRSGRIGRWRRALGRIQAGGNRPQLNFVHAFFPHEPRQYLPDGKEYQAGAAQDSSLEGPPSYNNRFLTEQGWQRELLQAEFTDRLVGELIARLKQVGAYERALIAITADHGESFAVSPQPAPPFVPGKLGFRRAVTDSNAGDIAAVPLFVKYPEGHGPHGTDERYVHTIDVLPTITDVLGIRLPFKLDGHSLLDRAYRGHDEIYVGRTFGDPLRMPLPKWNDERKASLRRRIELFGQGDEQPGLFGLGPRPDLLGRRVGSVPRASATATVLEPRRFTDVDPEATFSPSYVAGRISGSDTGDLALALALNGEIVATAESFPDLGPNKLNWAILFPDSKLKAGRNEVQLLQADGERLSLLARAP